MWLRGFHVVKGFSVLQGFLMVNELSVLWEFLMLKPRNIVISCESYAFFYCALLQAPYTPQLHMVEWY